MTLNSIETTISHMNNNLLRMGFLVETQIKRAIRALVEKDAKLAELVLKEDIQINNLMRDIEDEAIRLIATQGPVASDLRNIFTIIKIVTDLERMGDHAKDIANITKIRRETDVDLINEELVQISDLVMEFIGKSLDSFVAKDKDTALELTKLDDKIDQLTYEAEQKMFEKANNNPELLKLAGDLQFVLKYLERNGDHATNICEWTIYIVTGKFKELN
ncbi:MAG: phosphate signaling complex protein PhoU [Clostridia bacterium]|nr:phosphate signaling complex protein PhoU [Clostridia bacterium]